MKNLITIIIVFLSTIPAFTQHLMDAESICLPSPNVISHFATKNYANNLVTGRADVNVPVYHLKDGTVNIPISLDYNTSGVKVNDHPDWVGSNWNLNAGGMITRIVKGKADEKRLMIDVANSDDFGPDVDASAWLGTGGNGTPIGILVNGLNSSSIGDVESYVDNNEKTAFWSEKGIQDKIFLLSTTELECQDRNAVESIPWKVLTTDGEPDEFLFKCMGYEGKFYFDPAMNIWRVNGDPAVRVEVATRIEDGNTISIDYNNIDFSILSTTLATIFSANVANSAVNLLSDLFTNSATFDACETFDIQLQHQIISGIQMTMPDGIIYKFEEEEINREILRTPNLDLRADTWHLTEVIYPNGESANFCYTSSPTHSFTFSKSQLSSSGDIIENVYGRSSDTKYLSKIETEHFVTLFDISESEEMIYDYEKIFEVYQSHLHDVNGLTGLDNTYANFHDLEYSVVSRVNNVPVPIPYEAKIIHNDVIGNFTELSNQASWFKLDSIRVFSKNNCSAANVSCCSDPICDLDNCVPIKNKVFTYDNQFDERLRLKSIQEKDLPGYYFDYNTRALPGYHSDLINTDHWGYLNGTALLNIDNIENQKTPNIGYTTAGILETVTLPTGGTFNLDYEANIISAVVKRDPITGQFNRFSESRVAGGLRVSRKTENPVFLSNSTFLDPIITTFSYQGGVINFEPLYNFQSVHPIYHPSLNLMDNSVDGNTNTSGPNSIDLLQVIDYLPLSEIYNAEVQYETVWENQSGNGWTNYTFSTSMNTAFMNDNFVDYQSDNNLNIPQTAPYRSDQHRRGLIESIRFLKEGTGNIIAETQFDYDFFSLSGQSNSIHSCQILNRGVFDFAEPIFGKSTIHVGPYNLSETRHFEYDNFGNNPIITVTNYDYENTFNQLRETTSFRDFDEDFNLDPSNTNGICSEEDTEIITTNLYAFDFLTSGNGGIFDIMMEQNLINWPIQSDMVEAGVLIDRKRTDFITIAGTLNAENQDIVVPKAFWKRSGINDEIDYSVVDWDEYGNITSYRKALPGTIVDDNLNANLFDYTTFAFSYSENLLVNEAILTADGSYLNKNKTYQYDPNTRLLTFVADENGIRTEFEYDSFERLITKTEDNDRKRTTYQYFQFLNSDGNNDNPTNRIRTSELFDYDLNTYWSTSFITDTHFDGLGRVNENERIGYAPDNSTITATSLNYDEFGRVESKYLHGKDEFVNRFDSSPLNRKLRSESVIGDQDYEFIGHNIDYIETENNLTGNDAQTFKTFPPGSLSLYRSIDVNRNTTLIYKDFAGRTVRKAESVNGGTENVNTFFIYDELGRIQNTFAPNGAFFAYLYNERGLLFQKEISGQGGTNNYYYDERDRMVLHIDPENNQNITVYDAFDRIVEEGLSIPLSFNGNNNLNSINTSRLNFRDFYFGINNTAAQLTPDDEINEYIYESAILTPTTLIARDWIVQHSEYDINSFPTAILLNKTSTYDDIGRATSTVSTNQFGNIDTDNFSYNHLGLLSKHSIDHNRPIDGTSDFNFTWIYIYDTEHRLLETRLSDGINSNQVISKVIYDNYDRVAEKVLGEEKYQYHYHFLQNINYKYDPFSRLIEINNRCPEDPDQPFPRETSSDSTPQLSTISIQLGKFDILRLFDLEYTEEAEVQSLKNDLNFPYTLIPETDNGFSKDLQEWLIDNNYIIEKVDYKVDYAGNTTLILQNTNFDLEKIHLYGINKNRVSVIGKNSKKYRKIVGQYCPTNTDPVYHYNDDLFYEKINYPIDGSNIGYIEWGTTCNAINNDIIHRYDFNYDELDRMLVADYTAFGMDNQEIAPSNTNYDVTVGYDLVGNITNLTRNGMLANGSFGPIDNLTYIYDSNNRLDNVNESNPSLDMLGFQTLDPNGDDTYDYSANGNIIENGDKGLNFLYNHQNKLVSFDNGAGNNQNISYFGGNRLYRKVTQENGTFVQRDYIGNVEYVNGQIEAVYHSDGRLLPRRDDVNYPNKITGWAYEFFIKDHLGNTRVAFKHVYDENNTDYATNGFGEITYLEGSYGDSYDVSQVNHYYPFGMKMGGFWNFANSPADSENQYQYNGKELNTDLDLNWYDYGARMYDPSIGRFMGVDPLADKYNSWSPYTYTLNNPIKYIDPDGRDVWDYNVNTQEATWVSNYGGNETDYIFNFDGDNIVGYDIENVEHLGYSDDYFNIYSQPGRRVYSGSKRMASGGIDNGGVESTFIPMAWLKFGAFPFLKGFFGKVGQQIFGHSASSKILGKNLLVKGVSRPSNTAAHHIVAGMDKRAGIAQSILKREKIDINDAMNGVFLPKSSKFANPPTITHSRIHTNRYYQTLNSRLQNTNNVKQELKKIRREILKGTFPY